MIFKQSLICNVADSIFHLYELVDYDFTSYELRQATGADK